MKITFFVILGIMLIVLGLIGFLLPVTTSGLTVLEADKLCQKSSDSFSSQEDVEPEVCKYTKFFNAIYFLFGVGLVLIFWSGFLEKHYRHKF
ncbi:MAG: hypothetical protein OEQ12_03735 [Nitrosopumilus sp.]|nr:hypothetical protein [Nitrosopumilus sp.]